VKLVPFSREAHAATKLRPVSSFAFARSAPLIPLYGAELGRAALAFPLAFTAEKEGFFPSAMMGVDAGRNLFVAQDGRWIGGYLPAVLRRQPFLLAKVEGSDDWVLCLDEDSELISTQEGQPLVSEDGTASSLITQMTSFLAELERNRAATLAACAVLDRHGLLSPWDLKIARDGGVVQKVEGLFKVDMTRLAEASGETMTELRDSGALTMIYAQEISMLHLPLLGKLAAAHAETEAKQAAIKDGNWNLDTLFGVEEDTLFQF